MPSLRKQSEELRARRARLAKEAQDIVSAPAGEDGKLSAEQEEKFDRLHEECEQVKRQYERLERQADLDDALTADAPPVDTAGNPVEEVPGERTEAERKREERAFRNWCRYGLAAMEPEERAIVERRRQTIAEIPPEARALAAGTDTAGGFTVPEDSTFMSRIVEALKDFSGILQSPAEVITTDGGLDLPIPTDNDTTNKGAILSENVQVTEQDIVFGQVVLSAFMYTSKLVRVSIQLLQDSAVDLDGYLGRKLGERLGRIFNEHLTVGTGSAQPRGIVTAAPLGATAAAAGAIAVDDLTNLKHSVDPAYRVNEPRWMFADGTLKAIKQLKDADNRPLWQAGIAVGEPDRIDGDLYIVNNDVAAIGTGLKSVVYGDFRLYTVRRVRGIQLMRLTERYADFLQVGFLAFGRLDGDLVDAGTGPVKHLVHP